MLTALRKQDQDAVETLVRENIGWMIGTAQRIVSERSQAEDIVQAAFINIFAGLDTFRGDSSLRHWMRRVVVNQSLTSLRAQKRLGEVPIDDLMPTFDANECRIEDVWHMKETPETLLASTQVSQTVLNGINQLPDIYRVILLLRDIEEFTTSEVAQTLDLSETNVKVRLHRARSALKKLLEPLFKSEFAK